ncbi:MAG TPA: TPM domain-containing protein [Candidatus Baltobacteraceae bacterium]|jgi:uncharacterized protein|nr:TPM domain-containing protein [Candidatus Baltobacteraceae bacterium]
MIGALVLAAAVQIPARPATYVTDTAGALSAPARAKIDDELRTYEAATKHHVIVWIGETTGDTPLEDWTIHAAEQWKIGRPGIDDGVILFLFMRDHHIRIEVGYGLESALTDAQAGDIIRNTIVPEMHAGDTDAAVELGVNRIVRTITPAFSAQIQPTVVPSNQPSAAAMIAIFMLIGIFFFVFILIIVFGMRGSRRAGAGWYSSGWGSFGSSSGGFGGGGGSFGGSFGGGGASGSW